MTAADLARRAALPVAFALISVACREHTAQGPQPLSPETVYVRQPDLRQRFLPLEVAPRALAFDAIGDTVRVRYPAGSECASGNDAVARVDTTGLVRATGNGETQLRCWLEGRGATLPVRVSQRLARVEVRGDNGLAMRRRGDSLQLALSHTDRLGHPVQAARPSAWSSLAPDVVKVDPVTGVATGVVDSGAARVVGMTDGMADTVTLEVGVKSEVSRLRSVRRTGPRNRAQLARTTIASARPGQAAGAPGLVTPTSALQQGPVTGVRPPGPADSLFRDPTADAAGRFRRAEPTLIAGFAEHRVSQIAGLEKTSGAVFGAAANVNLGGPLSVHLQFLTGKLAKDTATVLKDRSMSAARVEAGIQISPWLTILAGGEARRYESAAVERWLIARAGGEANVGLGGGSLRGVARLFVLPLISIANSQSVTTAPSFGLASEIGLATDGRRFVGSLLYSVERYSFPSTSGRKEQLAALLFRVGYKL
jgi:hypothetical protein